MSSVRRIAAIDIGTVTTRLLVADVAPGSVVQVERSTDITHLGEGMTSTGALSRAAMDRVAEVIGGYAERIRGLGVETVTAVATSASRDAANSAEFVALLAAHGIEPRVIEGSQEAELSFLGATFGREGENLLVVDCGGGSTELILGDALDPDEGRPSIAAARSVDVGSRRMTELYLASDPPTRSELAAARSWCTQELRPYFDSLRERPGEMIALAGTATTLAAVAKHLAVYDADVVHGSVIDGPELAEVLAMLAALPLERRREVVGLHPGRAGVIVAGLVILETVLALAGLDRLTVSEHDILYGILLDTYDKLQESGGTGETDER